MWVACAATQSHGDVWPELLLRTMSESVVLLHLGSVLSVSHITKGAHSIRVYWNPWAMMSCLHPSLTLGDLVLHPFRRTAPTPHRRVGSASHEKTVPPHIPSSVHPPPPPRHLGELVPLKRTTPVGIGVGRRAGSTPHMTGGGKSQWRLSLTNSATT